ncbi:MAG: ABC transporter substrate-binding protein [Frankiaceae bacterium]
MTESPRGLAVAVIGIVLALTATACSSSSGSGSASGSAGPAGLNPDVVSNPSDAAGGTLQLVFSDNWQSLDPARTHVVNDWDFMRFIYRPLLNFSAQPRLIGDLATEPAVPTDGEKTWKYTLRSGVKYQDGTVVTSKDVKYAIERPFAEDVISGGPAANYVLCYLSACGAGGKPAYPGPYQDKSPDHLGLTSVETPDDQTIIFHLNKPFPDWNSVMALPISTPVPQSVDQGPNGGANYENNPVATGPYQIAQYEPDKITRLARNPNWDKYTDPLRKALPDEVVVTQGISQSDEDSRIMANQADAAVEGAGVQVNNQATVLTPRYQDRRTAAATGALLFLSVQQSVPPFDNEHCRKAVQYAVSKSGMQRARGGPYAGGDIALSTYPPTLEGYQPPPDLYPNGPDDTGNLDAARSELQQCGKPGGFTTNMAYNNAAKDQAVFQSVQQALSRVNITVNPVALDQSSFFEVTGVPSDVKKQGLGIINTNWSPDFPAPYGFYYPLVDGEAILQESNTNVAEINVPQINNLIAQSLETTDRQQYLANYRQVDQLTMQQAGIVPYLHQRALNVYSARLRNILFLRAFGLVDFQAMGVNP